MISLQQLYDAEERAMRAQAEAARYRAALEALCDASSWGMGVDPKRVSCRWCGALWPGDHHAICPKAIAHRALHPEGEEG